jgi:hypothetical protein
MATLGAHEIAEAIDTALKPGTLAKTVLRMEDKKPGVQAHNEDCNVCAGCVHKAPMMLSVASAGCGDCGCTLLLIRVHCVCRAYDLLA